jgi:hypothetical protein
MGYVSAARLRCRKITDLYAPEIGKSDAKGRDSKAAALGRLSYLTEWAGLAADPDELAIIV